MPDADRSKAPARLPDERLLGGLTPEHARADAAISSSGGLEVIALRCYADEELPRECDLGRHTLARLRSLRFRRVREWLRS